MNPSALHTVTLNPALDQTVTLARLRPGEVNLAEAVAANAGGKGVNVASCLADWGVPSSAHGLLGRDNAAAFEALFAAKSIPDRMLRLPGATRVNIKLADRESGDTTDINLPGLSAAPADLEALAARLAAEAKAGDGAALAGSLPRGLPDDSWARLCRQLKQQGAWVLLDSSGPALAAALAGDALPDAIKPNRHELEQWAGRPLDSLDALIACGRELLARGVGLVTVSLGSEGALLLEGDSALLASLPPQRPLSSVGAGDALVAGLCAAWREQADPERRARLAVAFAAAKLRRIGPHLPARAEIETLAAQASLRRLP